MVERLIVLTPESCILSVTNTKNEYNAFKELRKDTPKTCETVQDRMRKIQSDIAQLKHKVNKARVILTSLQVR